MSDGIDVVANALAAHRESNGGEDSSGMDSMGNQVFDSGSLADEGTSAVDNTTVVAEGTTTETTTQEKVDAAVESGASQDEIDKILEAEGVRPPTQGQRENRIPYSQVKRITTNAQKKWQTEADAKFASERQQFQQTQERLRNWEVAEQLAATDPEKYIRTLAQLNPAYQKFLAPLTAAVTDQQKNDDPEPQPTQMADGTLAYTPEQWKAHQSWERRQAVREATTAVDEKLKPILEERKQREAREQGERIYNERLVVVQAQKKRLDDVYGADVVKANEEAIVAKMKEAEKEGYYMSMAEAAMLVITPQIRAQGNQQRQAVLKELQRRPAAAAGSIVAAQRTDDENTPVTGDDVIHQALRAHRQGRSA